MRGRAEIITAAAIDYKIIELAQNVDRRDLTAAQRKECRSKLKAMLKQRLPEVKSRPREGAAARAAWPRLRGATT